jgi:pentatricopeptide repeat protein
LEDLWRDLFIATFSDSTTFSILLDALVRNNYFEEANDFIKLILSKYEVIGAEEKKSFNLEEKEGKEKSLSFEIMEMCHNMLMFLYGKSGNIPEVVRLLNLMTSEAEKHGRPQLAPNTRTYENLVNGFKSSSSPHPGVYLSSLVSKLVSLQEGKKKDKATFVPHAELFRLLLPQLHLLSELETGVRAISLMRQSIGFVKEDLLSVPVIEIARRHQNSKKELLQIFKETSDLIQDRENLDLQNTKILSAIRLLLQGLCDVGCLEESLLIYRSIKEEAKRNAPVMNSLLTLCYKRNRKDDFETILEEMRSYSEMKRESPSKGREVGKSSEKKRPLALSSYATLVKIFGESGESEVFIGEIVDFAHLIVLFTRNYWVFSTTWSMMAFNLTE